MRSGSYYDLIDSLKSCDVREQGHEFLRVVADHYGLAHVAYLGVNIPTLTDKIAFGVTTYDHRWVSRYIAEDYIRIDPVVRQGMSQLLPLDWSTLHGKNRKTDQFFIEAGEFGVGLQGLSFPIRGAHGETALFSVNTNDQQPVWEKRKARIMRDMQIIAYQFHTLVLESEGVRFEDVALTAREKECLKWAADGKTSWETGEILGIRSTTVEFYIEQARVKLNATNKVQAVAKALRVNAI